MKMTPLKIWPCLFLVIVLFVSCTKKAEEDNESRLFNGYAKNLKAYSGHNRVKLTFEANNDHIDHFVLSWNNKGNSKIISKEEANSGIIQVIVEGLNEGNHSFDILAYDQADNPAVASASIQVQVYGEKYIISLQNRDIKELTFLYGKDPVLDWSDAQTGEIALDIYYTNETGKPDTMRIPDTQKTATIPGYVQNTTIQYRSLYLPVKSCIDTFYSPIVTLPPPAYYASVATKNIVEKSGLVNQVISQSASDLYGDVEYSTLRFRDQSNEPLSIFILRVDLSEGKLTLSPLMPDNDTKFGLQTIKGMAESRDQADGKVLAAVNADFFDWSPVTGTPWGPVIINEKIVKDYAKSSGLTYFAIKKDGNPQIGYSSSLTELEYTSLRSLVGGGAHWLVVNGVNGSWGGDTPEPRTSAGYTNDQVVYLVVVDGRKPEYSVGVELTDMAKIMHSLGAYQAINLDGGGSSTMVIKEGSTFKIVNRYSDTNPRAVANGLAIMGK